MRERIISSIDRCRKYKKLIVPAGEAVLFILILFLSYWIRFGELDKRSIPQIAFLSLSFVPIKVLIFWIYRLYHISFRYISLQEATDALKASFISGLFLSLIGTVSASMPFMQEYPQSIVFIDFMLTFIVSTGMRFSFRLIYFPSLSLKAEDGKKILIVGAGTAGEQLVRELKRSTFLSHIPMVLVDDNPGKQGSIIHGLKVMGDRKDIPRLVRELDIEEIIISLPSASSTQLKGIMDYVRSSGAKDVKIVPGLFHILTGKVGLGDVRDITVEDVLGRESVKIDLGGVVSYLSGKRVLVTGAGGSIGSELCKQIASFKPSSLIMVDIGDTALFSIDRQIKEKFPFLSVISSIADVKDAVKMRDIFSHYSPQIVFHAAAYKHVPLMETNPRETVLNNIEGTKIVASLSIEGGIEKFIFISTDKAVNPTSVMGATKKIAENILKQLDSKTTKLVSVSFGNVLGSSGSVVPIFKEQIRKGGPITVTHPDMTRYFMSITEAVYLVLQVGAMGGNGEIFVLDMGKPIKILDLAHDVIRFYGLEPDKDIPIVFTGKRPGEKLQEELVTVEGGAIATRHEKIFIARDLNNLGPKYIEKVEELIKIAKDNTSKRKIISLLKVLVPTYQPESTRQMR
jgi:FlaA1/EpsC-like NDP-sugar epimerase